MDRAEFNTGKFTDGTGEVTWHTRKETPPKGRIWASDGIHVWLIWSDGEPISEYATLVLYWCDALIPEPPMKGWKEMGHA